MVNYRMHQFILIRSGDDLAVFAKRGESRCKELGKIPKKVIGLLASRP